MVFNDALVSVERFLAHFLRGHYTEPLLEEFPDRRLVRVHEIARIDLVQSFGELVFGLPFGAPKRDPFLLPLPGLGMWTEFQHKRVGTLCTVE